MSIKSALEKRGEDGVDAIQKQLEKTGSNSSYDLSNSVESEVTEKGGNTRLTISAFDYIFDVDEGRSPEEQREEGFDKLFDDYEDWVEFKNVTLFDGFDSVENMIAAMVVTSMQEGTKTYRSGESLGIIKNSITPKFIADTEKEILDNIENGVLEIITKISKDANSR